VSDLFADIPASVKLKALLSLPHPLSEPELLSALAEQSANNDRPSFLGGGIYNHFVPSAVKHLVARPEFYTAYTPYQAEASQGTLQAIYEYQSMVCALTGMEVANASMYDGATALAEAAFMAVRLTGRKEVVVSTAVNPYYREVLRTYCRAADLPLREIEHQSGLTAKSPGVNEAGACFILQQPNFFGNIESVADLADKIHAAGGLFIVAVDPISLGLLTPPGEYGADIVIAEGQALGNAQNFGGPGLGIFAVKKAFVRQMPGRVVGETVDLDGQRGFVLTLSTREQHIRRERATSNICSNEALCALAATIYLSLLGKTGLKKVAELSLQKSNYVKGALPADKLAFPTARTFKEFVVKTEKPIGLDLAPLYPALNGYRLICVTELAGRQQLDDLLAELS
jgi:glycine dehydrogenase subunit 1